MINELLLDGCILVHQPPCLMTRLQGKNSEPKTKPKAKRQKQQSSSESEGDDYDYENENKKEHSQNLFNTQLR